jgi:hypothetical protein
VDHLDEVAGADRAGVDVALLDPRIAPVAPGVRSISPMPGASAAKIGSRRSTTALSPPIIMQ